MQSSIFSEIFLHHHYGGDESPLLLLHLLAATRDAINVTSLFRSPSRLSNTATELKLGNIGSPTTLV